VFNGLSDEAVFNGSTEHASLVIEQAFNCARQHVRVLSSTLNLACYGTPATIAAAQQFLAQPGTRLEILIESDRLVAGAAHPLLTALRPYKSQIDVRMVPTDMVDQYEYNFLTVDDRGFRYEEDRRAHVAIVAGGQHYASATANLIEVFDALRDDCQPLKLAA